MLLLLLLLLLLSLWHRQVPYPNGYCVARLGGTTTHRRFIPDFPVKAMMMAMFSAAPPLRIFAVLHRLNLRS
jgi:hypothetical protein